MGYSQRSRRVWPRGDCHADGLRFRRILRRYTGGLPLLLMIMPIAYFSIALRPFSVGAWYPLVTLIMSPLSMRASKSGRGGKLSIASRARRNSSSSMLKSPFEINDGNRTSTRRQSISRPKLLPCPNETDQMSRIGSFGLCGPSTTPLKKSSAHPATTANDRQHCGSLRS